MSNPIYESSMNHKNFNKKYLTTVLLGVGFLLLMALYFAWVWTSEITDFGGDSAGYLMAAKYYSPYYKPTAAILGYKGQIIYPPVFPWILALVNGGQNLLMAHLAIAVFALAGFAILFFWMRKELVSPIISAAIVLIFALMPATYLQALNIWTEFPYLFFSLAAAYLLCNIESSSPLRIWLFAALIIATATLIRVAALPLLAAFGVFLLIKRPRHLVLIGLVAALPFALWAIYSSHSETGAGAYVSHWSAIYADDPIYIFFLQAQKESTALLDAWKLAWLGLSFSNTLIWLIDGFGVVCIIGWLIRLARLKYDAIYFLIYVIMLMAWPHPEEALRYGFVVIPFFIAYGVMLLFSIRILQSGALQHLSAAGIVLALLGLAIVPTLAKNAQYSLEPVPNVLRESTHTAEWHIDNRQDALQNALFHSGLIAHLKEIITFVPEGDCIFSIKPTVVMLYTNRSSYGPPVISEKESEFNNKIMKCRFAYLLPFASPSYPVYLYPLDRLGKKAKILSAKKLYDEGTSPTVGILVEIQSK